MNDITERLRSLRPANSEYTLETIAEAADEIERLRVERDEARKTMREWSENCGAEVQRLRQIILDLDDHEGAEGWSEELRQRVREAVGDKP